MKRADALRYVSFALDDALSDRTGEPIPDHARLVGYQCGFEPLFIAVWSYLGIRLDESDAEDIARDYLIERRWFTDCDNPPDADYII